MKASDLIADLAKLIAKHGDVSVLISKDQEKRLAYSGPLRLRTAKVKGATSGVLELATVYAPLEGE